MKPRDLLNPSAYTAAERAAIRKATQEAAISAEIANQKRVIR